MGVVYIVLNQNGSKEMDQTPNYSLHDMGLPLLAEYCAWELSLYRRGESSNDQYCVELCRRVTVLRDPLAWQVARQHFADIIYHWLRRHPCREAAYHLNAEEYYVAAAFTHFWQATVGERQVVIPSLTVALRYLRASLDGAILDALRTSAELEVRSTLEPGQATTSSSQAYNESKALWETIQRLLPGERERRLAYLLYHCRLKPGEIVQLCPQEFGDTQEIYRLRHRIVERLRDVL